MGNLGVVGPSGRPLTRRGVLGLASLTGLSACSLSDPVDSPEPGSTAAAGPVAKKLTWAQWPGYIDYDENSKKRPTLDRFVADEGIKVDYQEVVNDNTEYVETIKSELEAGKPVGADIITLTSWMAARLVQAKQLQPIGALRNADNLISALRQPAWDPEQKYAMPWQAGLTGIAYDARRVTRAIGSFDELFTRSDLKGRVGGLTEFADSVGVSMLALGKNPATGSIGDVGDGVDYLNELSDAGWFKGFYGNDFGDPLAKGEIDACLAWSGDAIQLQLDNPYLKFVMPEEGLMIWADWMLVPKGSKAARAAAKLIDYYYQPKVAAELAAYVNYICPVEGAQEEMLDVDPDLAENPLIFPDQSLLDRCFQLTSLDPKDDGPLRAQFDSFAQ
ncbi:MAG: ABC transporter substrate-binding protein [Nocardioides sp.]